MKFGKLLFSLLLLLTSMWDVLADARTEKNRIDVLPVLLQLYKRIRSNGELITQVSDSIGRWCQNESSHRLAVTENIERQLQEATIMARQISLDETRLQSEAGLANAAESEKEQQLEEVDSTVAFATAEYSGEQTKVDAMGNAVKHALDVVHVQMQRQSNADPENLYQTLQALQSRVKKEQDSTKKEKEEADQKLVNLKERATASIMETKSQVAAVNTELAHRNRERTLLQGKIAALTRLLDVVRSSAAGTTSACASPNNGAIAVMNASDILKKKLEEVTQTGQDADKEQDPQDSPSFLQTQLKSESFIRDLKQMAKAFPEESSLYLDGSRRLAHSAQKALVQVSESVESTSNTKHSAKHGDSKTLETGTVKSLYSGLLELLNDKQDAAQKRQQWCVQLAHDAAIDAGAVGRSFNRTRVKLALAQTTVKEYESNAVYFEEQGVHVATALKDLSKMFDDEVQSQSQAEIELGVVSQQLVALASEDETAAKDLSQIAFAQKAALEEWHVHVSDQHAAIVSANSKVQTYLAEEAKRNRERLIQFKSEAQFFAAMSKAKQGDMSLSKRYQDLSKSMCLSKRIRNLRGKEEQLKEEAEKLLRSYSENVADRKSVV